MERIGIFVGCLEQSSPRIALACYRWRARARFVTGLIVERGTPARHQANAA